MRESRQTQRILGEFLTRRTPATYTLLREKAEVVGSSQNFSKYLIDAISKQKRLFLEWDGYNFQEPRPAEAIRHDVSDDVLTPFGQKFRDLVKGRTFIDLPCGDPKASGEPRALAEAFGATRYIGVDKAVQPQIQTARIGEEQIPEFYINEDILTFLSQIEGVGKTVVYMSGLEFFQLSEVGRLELEAVLQKESTHRFAKRRLEADTAGAQYREACLAEMARILQPGDALIIGRATHGFNPEKYGFRLDEVVKFPPPSEDTVDHAMYIKE